MYEIARTGIDVAVVAIELQSQHAADDVQARLVALVVVLPRYRSRLGLDLAGPEQRQLECQGAIHARRGVCRGQVSRREDPYGPWQLTAHQFSMPPYGALHDLSCPIWRCESHRLKASPNSSRRSRTSTRIGRVRDLADPSASTWCRRFAGGCSDGRTRSSRRRPLASEWVREMSQAVTSSTQARSDA